ncbi:Flap endonuclease GEN-like 1 [Platanthera zijinensis]|uniref:Flap endonuclease GEN-like 1 n=1 Tax=Platanthera zijinensis TaxID=2320716 RepID=A0AAP0BC24_9ASPA
MGIGGSFWDLLKPYARFEGVDFLRDKRVAVDLSFWVVQHDAAIHRKNPSVRSPHLRVTFFRTLALFTKLGAFPVFVVDGDPSPLKDQARVERFLRGSCLDPSLLRNPSESAAGQTASASRKRNRVFSTWVQECVELLEILGMPVLKAQSEAEALCAQLNMEGHVHACITSDSDAFLYGAKCVIKGLQSNSKEPFECYYLSDIQDGLGLKRKQMIAIALLVGSDHDLQGVSGFGTETALRFVKLFSDDEVLDRLCEVGKGIIPPFHRDIGTHLDYDMHEGEAASRPPHCSHCGHPGSRRAHLMTACEYCINCDSKSCIMKSTGFKCNCSSCIKDRIIKEQRKQETWQFKACQKIAAEHDFPSKEIIDMYLNESSHDEKGALVLVDSPSFRWQKPSVENLVDFLTFHQHWKPCYIRQRIIPMLSTIFLREMALTPDGGAFLYDQYEFHAVERTKIRYGRPYYSVKWKKATHSSDVARTTSKEELESEQTSSQIAEESMDPIDDPDVPALLFVDGCSFLITEEITELVQSAFPKAVEKFLQEKHSKETKWSSRKSDKSKAGSDPPKSSGVQLSITEFYRSTKPAVRRAIQAKGKQKNLRAEEPSDTSSNISPNLDQEIPKSVRRRLLFD